MDGYGSYLPRPRFEAKIRLSRLLESLRVLQMLVHTVTLLALMPALAAAEQVSLGYDIQGLDLDSGMVEGHDRGLDVFLEYPEADIRIAYHADRPVHSVVVHNVASGVQLALLANTPFDDVLDGSVPGTVLGGETIDQPFNPGDTLIVRTDQGALFKIGNAAESSGEVAFDYEPLVNITAKVHLLEGPFSRETDLASELAASDLEEVRQHLNRELSGSSRSISLKSVMAVSLLLLLFIATTGLRISRPLSQRKRVARTLVAGFALCTIALGLGQALELYEQQKLTASDASLGDRFGFSVAVDRNTAAIGALFSDGSGATYVFVRGVLGTWAEQQKLLASDGASGDRFGESVSVSGDTVLVGAPGAGPFSDGSAYVFVRSGTSWTQQQKLSHGGGPGVGFGSSVSVYGDTAVVGAPGTYRPGVGNTGSAEIFVRSGGIWTHEQQLTASDGEPWDRFGSSVSLNAGTAAVGTPQDDDSGSDSGSTYVFIRDSLGTWTQQQKLLASDGAAVDFFGHSVSVNGDAALVGMPSDDDTGSDSGSTYVFVRDSLGTWMQQQKLLADDGAPFDRFGRTVSLNGGRALVGAAFSEDAGLINSGSAYVFARDALGTWTQEQKLVANDGAPEDFFGDSVSLSSETALIGARGDDGDAGFDSGSVYVFIPTPREQVEALVGDVVDLNLQEGIENGLDSKLDAVQQALDDLSDNNNEAAIAALRAFINAVEAQRGKKIPEADADRLIAEAEAIIAQLEALGSEG